MFHPFHDRNPHFFGIFVFDQITHEFFFYGIIDCCGSYCQFLPCNWFFRTYMESNAAVMIHFEDLAVTNSLSLKRRLYLLMNNLKLFSLVLWVNVKVFF